MTSFFKVMISPVLFGANQAGAPGEAGVAATALGKSVFVAFVVGGASLAAAGC